MYAIKGTTAAMQCLGYQYELGKTYKMDEEPILCRKGFHACLNPYDVLDYYENDGYSRYFLVDLGGTITDGDINDTKVAANEITFLKEITDDDFPTLYEEFLNDKERLAKLKYIDGFARVRKDYEYNFINKNCKYISKKWFDFVYFLSEGFSRVWHGGRFNFINKDGKLLSKCWFDRAWDFSEGFAWVNKNLKWYKLYPDGHLVDDDDDE